MYFSSFLSHFVKGTTVYIYLKQGSCETKHLVTSKAFSQQKHPFLWSIDVTYKDSEAHTPLKKISNRLHCY